MSTPAGVAFLIANPLSLSFRAWWRATLRRGRSFLVVRGSPDPARQSTEGLPKVPTSRVLSQCHIQKSLQIPSQNPSFPPSKYPSGGFVLENEPTEKTPPSAAQPIAIQIHKYAFSLQNRWVRLVELHICCAELRPAASPP